MSTFEKKTSVVRCDAIVQAGNPYGPIFQRCKNEIETFELAGSGWGSSVGADVCPECLKVIRRVES